MLKPFKYSCNIKYFGLITGLRNQGRVVTSQLNRVSASDAVDSGLTRIISMAIVAFLLDV